MADRPLRSLLLAGLAGVALAADGDGPWPAPVAGHVAAAPGEHPRLFFRKADLPALKKRAETPEGRAMIARLKVQLGGGEALPTVENGSTKAYGGNTAKAADGDGGGAKGEMPIGAYSIGHAAGFGLLWQLTGDKKYADLGKQCFEKAWAGVRDRDDRYAWKTPGGALRAGPALGVYAIGYDLCYDGWDAAFRERAAKEFSGYDQGQYMNLSDLAQGKRHGPTSNHWGNQVGGGALALLAINGDPGADQAKVASLLAANEKCMIRHVTEGFGDHGFFPEGDGPGAIGSDTAYVPALQAWKVAGGKDFITPRPNAQWLTLKWVMGTIPGDGSNPNVQYPKRGGYPHNVWARKGMSGSGTFAQGFGAIDPKYQGALLWTHRHCIAPKGDDYDGVNAYPHRTVLAFVNWPLGLKERNPAEVLPCAIEDKRWAYYAFRGRWQDEKDALVTALLKDARGLGSTPGGPVMVWGGGQRIDNFASMKGEPTFFKAFPAAGVVSTASQSLGVDFSGASGADALVVMTGGAGKGRTAGRFTYLTIGKDVEGTADADRLIVGGQTVSVENGNIVFAVTARK